MQHNYGGEEILTEKWKGSTVKELDGRDKMCSFVGMFVCNTFVPVEVDLRFDFSLRLRMV